jgi:hypothetical protein
VTLMDFAQIELQSRVQLGSKDEELEATMLSSWQL